MWDPRQRIVRHFRRGSRKAPAIFVPVQGTAMSIAVRSLFVLRRSRGLRLRRAASSWPRRRPATTPASMCHADKDGEERPGQVDRRRRRDVQGLGPRRDAARPASMCHADAADAKTVHPGKLKPVDCAGCHEKAVKPSTAAPSTARRRTDGKTLAASCTDCHGTHDIKRSKDPASRDQPREPRGHLLEVPRQRRVRREGAPARRQRRQEVPRQRPRQAAGWQGRRRSWRRPSAPTATARTTSAPRPIRRAA